MNNIWTMIRLQYMFFLIRREKPSACKSLKVATWLPSLLPVILLWILVGLFSGYAWAENDAGHFHGYTDTDKGVRNKLVEMTYPKNGSIVGDDVTLLGTYAESLGDDIWVMIWPEKTKGVGWPQYGDSHVAAPANKDRGHWSVNAHFGDPPQRYEIVIYTATKVASLFLQQQYQHTTSQGQIYQGISQTNLPEGLVERQRISVSKDSKHQPLQLIPLVKRIQDDLAQEESKTGFSYYKDKYSKNEVYFWSEIAGWMAVDVIDRIYTKNKPVKRILDLGCGFGTLLAYATTIYGAEGICFDIHDYFGAYGINSFNEKYHLTHVQGDIERGRLPDDKQFSVIIMTEVMEHLNFQPVPTLKKIYDALEPGGSFFLSTPDADIGWGRNYKYYQQLSDLPRLNEKAEWTDDHIWHYNTEELKAVVQEAGFTIKRFSHSHNPAKEGFGNFNVWLTK